MTTTELEARRDALREELEGPARDQDRKRAELASIENELAAQAEADALAAAKQEYTEIQKAVGGLQQTYKTDGEAVHEAGAALVAALHRLFQRYHVIAPRLDRARHLRMDHGVKGSLPLMAELPLQANEVVKAVMEEVASFEPYKQQPSPKQQAAAAAKRAAEDERRAQRAAAQAAELARSGYGKVQQQVKALSRVGRVQSI